MFRVQKIYLPGKMIRHEVSIKLATELAQNSPPGSPIDVLLHQQGKHNPGSGKRILRAPHAREGTASLLLWLAPGIDEL